MGEKQVLRFAQDSAVPGAFVQHQAKYRGLSTPQTMKLFAAVEMTVFNFIRNDKVFAAVEWVGARYAAAQGRLRRGWR